MRYSGRDFSEEEIQWIRFRIESDPTLLRTPLSREICERFNWRKPGGGLKEMRCRVVLLEMERDGVLCLPRSQQPGGVRRRPIERTGLTDPGKRLQGSVENFELALNPVGRETSGLWNEYIDRYHYLGHKTLGGEQLRYFVRHGGEIIGLIGFGASAWKVGAREAFIGWTGDQKEKNLYRVVNNARFLILPWIAIQNAASKILSMVERQLPLDWEARYGYRPVLLETFVQKNKFRGTCYQAANWIYVGDTQGRGRGDRHHLVKGPIKGIWLKSLCKDFRKILCSGGDGR